MPWRRVRATASAVRRRDPGGTEAMAEGLQLLGRIGVEPATIADVGASDGRWARLAHASFPSADLVLFEPQPVHHDALDRFQSNHPAARIVRSAVGGSSGDSWFSAADPFGGVLQPEHTAESITVSVVTLDEALAHARSPFLVKLDTHGVEAAILAGAEVTLTRSVALIIEAYNHRLNPSCLLFWELCGRLAERGFRPVELVDALHRPYDGTLWQMDLFFVRSDWDGFRYREYA